MEFRLLHGDSVGRFLICRNKGIAADDRSIFFAAERDVTRVCPGVGIQRQTWEDPRWLQV